jgi:hypothetical protein
MLPQLLNDLLIRLDLVFQIKIEDGLDLKKWIEVELVDDELK